MSAIEVIEQIRSLSDEERRKVFAFVREEEQRGQVGPEIRHANDEQFQAAKKRVFIEHRELLRRLAQ